MEPTPLVLSRSISSPSEEHWKHQIVKEKDATITQLGPARHCRSPRRLRNSAFLLAQPARPRRRSRGGTAGAPGAGGTDGTGDGAGVWAESRPPRAYLEHGDGAAGAVHLEGGGLVPRGGRAGLGLVVAEAGGGDVQVPEGQRLLRPLEVVEVAAAGVEHEPAAAEAAQGPLARQLLQVPAELGGTGAGLLPGRPLLALRARRRHRLARSPGAAQGAGPARPSPAASRDL